MEIITGTGKKSVESLRRLLELRRSNASSVIKSKKIYNRKSKRKDN